MSAFRLAHLSDLHLGPLPSARLRELLGKRLLGYASWLRTRRALHQAGPLAAVVADARGVGVDHIVVTGDLVNIGLPAEYVAATDWLRLLGPSDGVTVVPGNHDAYVSSMANGWSVWADWMGGLDPAGRPVMPFVKHAGPLALIGLSTAVPMPVGYAGGRLGQTQLAAFEEALRGLRGDVAARVVLLHHPPVEGWSHRRKALQDAARFREIVSRHGAELVLCGHEHRLAIGAIDGPDGEVPVLGAPSASMAGRSGLPGGGYLLFAIEPGERGCRFTVEHRAVDFATGTVVTALRASFAPADPARRSRARRVA